MRAATRTQLSYVHRQRSFNVGRRELRHVARMISIVAPSWSVKLHNVPAEVTSIQVLAEPNEDVTEAMYIIWRTQAGFHLDQLRCDVYMELDTFASIWELISYLRSLIAQSAAMASPVSVMCH